MRISAGSKLCAVTRATRQREIAGRHFPGSTWQGAGFAPPRCIPSLVPQAARGNRARFRTIRPEPRCRVSLMGGAPMTANDNTQPPRAKRSGSQKRVRRNKIPVACDDAEFLLIDSRAREVGLSRAEFSSRLWPWHTRPARQAQPARQCRSAGPCDGGAEQSRQQSEPDRPCPERRRLRYGAGMLRGAWPKPARPPPPSGRSWGAKTGHDFQRDDLTITGRGWPPI